MTPEVEELISELERESEIALDDDDYDAWLSAEYELRTIKGKDDDSRN